MAVYGTPLVLAIGSLGPNLGEFAVDQIGELARYGAWLILTSCLQAEVAAHLARAMSVPGGRGVVAMGTANAG